MAEEDSGSFEIDNIDNQYDPSDPSADANDSHTRDRSRSPVSNNKEDRRHSSSGNERSSRGNRDRSRERDRDRRRSDDRRDRGQDHDRDKAPRTVDPKKVYISNIPYEMTWQKIKDLIRDTVGETIRHVEMFESESGKSRGAGVLEFKDRESADKAQDKLNRHELSGRFIILRELRESDIKRHQRQGDRSSKPNSILNMNLGASSDRAGSSSIMGMGGGGGGGSGMMAQMMTNHGVPQQVLQQLCIEGPVTSQVFVANLDYSVTWKKLKDVFKMAGNVLRAEVMEDKDGKSRGFGTVSFETPLEACQAISMLNGQQLYNRTMTVKMDQKVEAALPKLPEGLRGIGMSLNIGGGFGGQQNQMENGPLSSGFDHRSSQMNQGLGMGLGNMGGGAMNNTMGMSGNPSSNLGQGGLGGMSNNMGGMGMNTMGSSLGGGNMGNTGLPNQMGMGGGMGMNDMGMSNMNSNFGSSNMGGGMGDFGSMNRGGGGSIDNSGNMMGMAGNMGMPMGGMISSYTTSKSSDSDFRRRSGGRGDSGRSDARPGQEGTIIFIKNLPYAVTWKDLKEHFRNVGDVKYAEIKMESGKSRGIGTVRFATPEQAQRAVDLMHGQRIEGREIVVRIDN